MYYIRQSDVDSSKVETFISRVVGSTKKTEKEVLAENLLAFPAWVAFPDFSRAEWINDLLRYTTWLAHAKLKRGHFFLNISLFSCIHLSATAFIIYND